jgi:hypothetical protein
MSIEMDAREALLVLHQAILQLSTIKNGKTLFEGSPSGDQDCYEAWVALDSAQKLASKVLGDRKPLKLLFTAEWLRKKIENSPDEENCEAGVLHPEAPTTITEPPHIKLLQAAKDLIKCIDGDPVNGRIDLARISEKLVPDLRAAIDAYLTATRSQDARVEEILATHEAYEAWRQECHPASLGLYRYQLEIHRQRGVLLEIISTLTHGGGK